MSRNDECQTHFPKDSFKKVTCPFKVVPCRIEEDKIARRAMFNMKTPEGAAAPPEAAAAAVASPPPAAAAAPTPKKDYSECRIQIRQTNGQPLVHR